MEKIIKQDKEIYEKVKQGEEINLVSLFNHIIYGRDSAILNIVSTNYDKIAEYAASQTDAFLNTGFSHNLRGVFFTDLNPKLYAKLKPYTGCINIWKVHGSLDWFYRNEDIFCFPNTYDIPLGCTPCIITPVLISMKKHRMTLIEVYYPSLIIYLMKLVASYVLVMDLMIVMYTLN